MARVAVIGAGAMGLAAAYHALKLGHQVDLFEAAGEPGGMAAHFDFAGLSIERFYHFVCKSDYATFELLAELDLSDRMRWVGTSMGYFIDGALHPWGDPLSLMRFPKLNWLGKFRYGLLMYVSARRTTWPALENISARDWITRWCGPQVYDVLWKRLFELKFYEYADPISAAWIWTRVKRVGRSRRSIFQEELGYIEGGTQTLVDALVAAILRRGGRLHLSAPIERIVISDGAVTGVIANGSLHPVEAVISTVPTPYVARMLPNLSAELKEAYDAIVNIGVVCVLFRLKRSVTPHFWVNICDQSVPIPGIIEFSNLRRLPNGESVVYVPYYMPIANPKFRWSDEAFLGEAFACIRRINPAITDADISASYVARLKHAQPICPPGFAHSIPSWQTPVNGLMIADTSFYYPEDRGISESVRFGKVMAEAVM
jgi:protoporphyrinogen oxidase